MARRTHKKRGLGAVCGVPVDPKRLRKKWDKVTCHACLKLRPVVQERKGGCGGGDPRTEPDYSGSCEVCGQSPIVPATGMCGPCTFGEAETAGGNW